MPPLLTLIFSILSITLVKNLVTNALSGLKVISKGIDGVRENIKKGAYFKINSNVDELLAKSSALRNGTEYTASAPPMTNTPVSVPSNAKVPAFSRFRNSKWGGAGISSVVSGLGIGLATGLATGDAGAGLKAGAASAILSALTSAPVIAAAGKAGTAIMGAVFSVPGAIALAAVAAVAGVAYLAYEFGDEQRQLEKASEKAKKKVRKGSKRTREKTK